MLDVHDTSVRAISTGLSTVSIGFVPGAAVLLNLLRRTPVYVHRSCNPIVASPVHLKSSHDWVKTDSLRVWPGILQISSANNNNKNERTHLRSGLGSDLNRVIWKV